MAWLDNKATQPSAAPTYRDRSYKSELLHIWAPIVHGCTITMNKKSRSDSALASGQIIVSSWGNNRYALSTIRQNSFPLTGLPLTVLRRVP